MPEVKDFVGKKIIETIKITNSHCLRMRYHNSSCDECNKICPMNAIRIDEKGVHIDSGKCTKCMLCVSSCPSGAFKINEYDFQNRINNLNKIESPVFGCNIVSGILAHEKWFCLGLLSEQHLIALFVLLEKPLQLNMTKCSQCINNKIIEVMYRRFKSLQNRTGIIISKKIIMVENLSDLKYSQAKYDRRGFFIALKDSLNMKSQSVLSRMEIEDESQAYSNKNLPFRYELQNFCVSHQIDRDKMKLLRAFRYNVEISDTCNDCFACIGICPSGALIINNMDHTLEFKSDYCIGCTLCSSFCPNSAISVSQNIKP